MSDPCVGPLQGIRILDFSQAMAGPMAAQKLGDMGADVIKVENTGSGEWHRSVAAYDAWLEKNNCSFLAFNRNKRSLSVNLKTEEGHAVVARLVKTADAALLNFRPGVAERIGVGYDRLAAINPGLVYCSISGYGLGGSYEKWPGQDLILQGMSGALFNTGVEGDPPRPAPFFVADATAANLAVQGLLAGLLGRSRGQPGQRVDVSLLDGLIDMQSQEYAAYINGKKRPRRSSQPLAHTFQPSPYGAYATADGYLILSTGPLDVLGEVIDRPELADWVGREYDTEARDRVFSIVAERLRQKTTAEWLKALRAVDYWCGPVFDYHQVLGDEQVRTNGTFISVKHPEEGELTFVGPPWKFGAAGRPNTRPQPRVGEHSVEVLSEIGYTPGEIDALVRSRAVQVVELTEETA